MELPLKLNGEMYKIGDKAEPLIIVDNWDFVKFNVMYEALRKKFS